MKKQILILSTILILTFMLGGVFAFDYSISGSKEAKTNSEYLKVSTQIWHSDGRAPTCYNSNRCSKGISPQGQGYLILTYENKEIGMSYRLNLALKEKGIRFDGNKAYGVVESHGTGWAKNWFMPRVWNNDIKYTYDKDAGTLTIFDRFLVMPVTSNK